MNTTAFCLVGVWMAGGLGLLAAKRLTPEIWSWYKWYVLVLEGVFTAVLLAAANM